MNSSLMTLTDRNTPDLPEWLHDLYPFTTRSLDVDGFAMSLADEGPGRTGGDDDERRAYVLVHGTPHWSLMFRDLIGRLRSQARVIAPDHIGFGLSEKPAIISYHTLERHIANFTALMDALELDEVKLVLHGWGGPIGLAWAAANPDRVSRLVLVNSWGALVPNVGRLKPKFAIRLARAGAVGRLLDSVLNLTLHAATATPTQRRASEMIAQGYAYPFSHSSRVAMQAFSDMFFAPDRATVETMQRIEAGLKNITAPVDILAGADDRVLTKLPVYQLRDALKNASEPLFVPNTTHAIPEEAPDVLAEVVLRDRDDEETSSEDLFNILG